LQQKMLGAQILTGRVPLPLHKRKAFVVLAIASFSVPLGFASGHNEQGMAESLLAFYQSIVNIRSDDSPSFRLRSNVHFLATAELGDAAYTEIWSSPDHWRREMEFQDFQQTEVGDRKRRWVLRDLEGEPPGARRLRELFAPEFGLSVGKVKNIRNEDVSGVQAKCVESRVGNINQSLCFDAATGVLLRHRERSTNRDTSYEYSNYQKIGEKRYPHTFRYYDNGQKQLEVEILELTTESSLDPGIFILTGAKEWPICPRIDAPVAVSSPDPSFPRAAKVDRAMSVFGVTIGGDGKLRGLRVLRSGGTMFDEAAMQAVRQWTFRPALCSGTPIPAQISVEIDFRR
jgi:TonB family protein